MALNNDSQKGYVYILTNPSFREDWIKIGKSSRPVDVRSKELDNTAVPLPFEIYATMRTASFDKVESMLHTILEGTGVRIRKNREFFNVKPEVALAAFYKIAGLLLDAEIHTGKDVGRPEIKTGGKDPIQKRTITKPGLVLVGPTSDLPERARYSFDGRSFYSMSMFPWAVIRQMIEDDPTITYPQLEALFPKTILTGYYYCGVVARKEVIEASNHSYVARAKAYHFDKPDYQLTTKADGVPFYVTTQWMRVSFLRLVSILQGRGYSVYRKVE